MKIILFILLLVAQGSFNYTRAQKDLLFDMANQCPITGGKAVYLARSLYNSVGHISYNDIALCVVQGVDFRTQKPKEGVVKATTYSLAPNPAADYAILKSTTALESEGVVVLYDVYGRVVSTYTMAKGATQLNIIISDLASGIYTCKLTVNNATAFVTKLSVLK